LRFLTGQPLFTAATERANFRIIDQEVYAMEAMQNLPETYQKVGTLDISKDQKLQVLLNVIGLAAMIGFAWLFLKAMTWLRPESGLAGLSQVEFRIGALSEFLGVVVVIVGLSMFNVVLHEAIHGLFFWLFTRSRPRFAFKLAYAYAAAPDWYIPRNQFLVTTLAPLVLISLAGLLIFAVAPISWLLPTLFVITINAGGAVGDLAVAGWLLTQPPHCLAQDRGDAVTLYK
jgi:hypothetical protein